MIANVVGATGLVGMKLVELLIDDERFSSVRVFVRRDNGITHPKLEQVIVDFEDTTAWEKHLTGDVLFSALGTTLKQAGSMEKEYHVDFTLNLRFASKALENGIPAYVLVSSVGANSRSKIFYTRMKGELDDAVQKLGFKTIAIIRPSMLMGKRFPRRLAEELSFPVIRFLTKFFFRKYRPIGNEIVAQAMINAVVKPNSGKIIYEAGEVFRLAEK